MRLSRFQRLFGLIRSRRMALIAWVCILLLLAYGKWGAHVRARLAAWRAGQIARNFAAPPERVVFEGDPQRAAALEATGDYRTDLGAIWKGFDRAIDQVTNAADRLDRLDHYREPYHVDGRDAPYVEPYKSAHVLPQALLNRDEAPCDIPIFLHELRSGKCVRLIEIHLTMSDYAHQKAWMSAMATIRPSSGLTDSQDARGGATGETDLLGPAREVELKSLRIYAAQLDPDDPSRCTAEYELRGHRGQIKFQLQQYGQITIQYLGPITDADAAYLVDD